MRYLTALCVVACIQQQPIQAKMVSPTKFEYEDAFFDHIMKYDLNFENSNHFSRVFMAFCDNYNKILEHNAKDLPFTLALNRFSHLTFSEFHDFLHLGGTFPRDEENALALHNESKSPAQYPASWDWSTQGAVTAVKYQGQCGSCWAFATTGALEGAYFLKNKNLKSFSEQELVSCATTVSGCNGGSVAKAMKWISTTPPNRGLPMESDYPYTSGNTDVTGTCTPPGNNAFVPLAPAYKQVSPRLNMDALATAVVQRPIALYIDASCATFQSYGSGVITDPSCTNGTVNHALLLVGYGTYSDATPYWKLKNSWGTGWGMNGYVLIERSDANLCNVLFSAGYPVL